MSETVIDLMREYVRVSDMVEAYNKEHRTDIKPWECVRYPRVKFDTHPQFIRTHHEYEFAVAILEGKPVFVGDEIYSTCGETFDWSDPDYKNQINFPYVWTWQKPAPKRTFALNGFELPCPVRSASHPDAHWFIEIDGSAFWFKTHTERDEVRRAITNTLTAARGKP